MMPFILGRPVRCFAYARKVFWAGPQGCIKPSLTPRNAYLYCVCGLVNPCEVITRATRGTIEINLGTLGTKRLLIPTIICTFVCNKHNDSFVNP